LCPIVVRNNLLAARAWGALRPDPRSGLGPLVRACIRSGMVNWEKYDPAKGAAITTGTFLAARFRIDHMGIRN
jgi:hypothetical protein